jgi:UDP-N-acetylmuramoyl-L-alanyl-D-glutamate--2,6-diaminopimelate ligase
MKLEEILNGVKYESINDKNNIISSIDIKNITIDSRRVGKNSMFFCIIGLHVDGHNFITTAINNGAVCIMIENNISSFDNRVVYIKVKNVREALAICSANFYNNPSNNFNLIGVTGTNGKTSTTHIIKEILSRANHNVGLIGTVNSKINDEVLDIYYPTATTPDPIELQKILHEMYLQNVDDVVIEVSSHALKLHKVDSLNFNIGVFTNLSQDHLDFHKTMQDYLDSKCILFKKCKIGIINADDSVFDYIKAHASCKIFSYGINNECDYRAINIICTECYVKFDVIDSRKNLFRDFYTNIPGNFSIYNSLCAIIVGIISNIPLETIKNALRQIKNVPGRMQKVNSSKFNVIVDYAHSPDSLEKVLKSIREFTKNRLICVFGCGGDRDKTKRPIMGKIAAEQSDYLIITSDNPRKENPEQIIKDVAIGLQNNNIVCEQIPDRREAIMKALKIYNDGDMILIAGKGHENYQIFADRTVYFDDVKVTEELIKKLEES